SILCIPFGGLDLLGCSCRGTGKQMANRIFKCCSHSFFWPDGQYWKYLLPGKTDAYANRCTDCNIRRVWSAFKSLFHFPLEIGLYGLVLVVFHSGNLLQFVVLVPVKLYLGDQTHF